MWFLSILSIYLNVAWWCEVLNSEVSCSSKTLSYVMIRRKNYYLFLYRRVLNSGLTFWSFVQYYTNYQDIFAKFRKTCIKNWSCYIERHKNSQSLCMTRSKKFRNLIFLFLFWKWPFYVQFRRPRNSFRCSNQAQAGPSPGAAWCYTYF